MVWYAVRGTTSTLHTVTVLTVCIWGISVKKATSPKQSPTVKWLLQQNSRVADSVFGKCAHKQRGIYICSETYVTAHLHDVMHLQPPHAESTTLCES